VIAVPSDAKDVEVLETKDYSFVRRGVLRHPCMDRSQEKLHEACISPRLFLVLEASNDFIGRIVVPHKR
jgi:hypothetical protein